MKRLTTNEFIEKSKKIHGDEYDYTNSFYVNAKTKVKITCREHGDFEMLPHNHIKGEGCPICRYIKSANKMRGNNDNFINEAILVHGNKYDYSKVKYIKNDIKVCIICPEHGEFWQTPEKHIHRKQGCPRCSGNARKTLNEFITESNIIHDNKYDYSKVEYKCNHKLVEIICPIHGSFWQRPKDHLKGQGCPHCKQSKIEKDVFNFLKNNNIIFESQYRYDKSNLKNSIDFFIPNIKIGIECQGEQHFKPVDFANNGNEWAKELFEKNVFRDERKKNICEDIGIKLIYYVPKKNTIPGYKSDERLGRIYTNENVCNNIQQLKKKIEGVSFDNI